MVNQPVDESGNAPVVHWSDPNPPTTWAPPPPSAATDVWQQPAGLWPAPGQNAPGQNAAGQSAFGQSAFGQSASGQSASGRPTAGQHPPNPAPLGSPHPGQPHPGAHHPGQSYPGQSYPGQNTGQPLQYPPPANPWQAPGNSLAGLFRRVQWVALAATLAVVLGSVIPFITYEEPELLRSWQVRPEALAASFLFGVVLTGLVALTRTPKLRTVASIALLVLALTGFCGYLLFTVVGLTSGIETQTWFATQTVHWSPGPGIVLCIVGTAVAAFQSVLILRDPQPPTNEN
ncbi:hypothetical protein KIH74_24375 [Kineosporia sp. J2-2]|uniref:Uncharacterized protein n=1 Tax=Kineosporia corallincola TaxID=2835133 RepID=A0ABS5TLY9_9ACTN|nr:hypothetical protein [Kineosporia corallincola]MBT0772102.1 hypothetical protein [Kineosporia corallincola]